VGWKNVERVVEKKEERIEGSGDRCGRWNRSIVRG